MKDHKMISEATMFM